MSAEPHITAPEQSQEQQKALSDKEINFSKVRKQLEDERTARLLAEQKNSEYEKLMQEKKNAVQNEDDESSDEPYVDHKHLKRQFSKFGKEVDEKIDKKAAEKAAGMFEEFKAREWLKANPDFEDVMKHADTLVQKDKELEELYLNLPNTFDRQKLVYKHIKALNLHVPEQPKQSIQEKIDQNRRSPFYQPTGVASAPYASAGDFSPVGKESAYKKMQQLKERLRLG